MKLNRYIVAVGCLTLLLCNTATSFAAKKTVTSEVNPYKNEIPVILDQKYWYKVQLPGAIDLKLDRNSDYSDEYKIRVKGIVPGKLIHVDTTDVDLTDEHHHKLVVENKMRKDESDNTWTANYTHEDNLTEDGITFDGKAWVNSKDIQPGNYAGVADYKFYLVDHKHTPMAAVKEDIIEPTCTKTGHYDSVVYCEECGKEISRETKTTAALGHNYPVTTGKDTTASKSSYYTGVYWTRDGDTQYVTCSRCGEKKSKAVNTFSIRVRSTRPDITGYSFDNGNSGITITPWHWYNDSTGASIDTANYKAKTAYAEGYYPSTNAYNIYLYPYYLHNGEWYKLTYIGGDTFNVPDWYKFYFQGTKAQFNAITKEKGWYGNSYPRQAAYIYCTDGSIKTH